MNRHTRRRHTKITPGPLPQPAVLCKITTAQKRMINRSNRRTRRRHTKITPAPFSTCRSLQNHNRPKKDDKPIEPPYIPPTHKNNARPLPQPAVPCKITTAQKRKSVIPNHAELVSAFHILFQSLTPFLICSGFPRCPALVYFSCRFLFSPVPYRFFVFLSRSFFTYRIFLSYGLFSVFSLRTFPSVTFFVSLSVALLPLFRFFSAPPAVFPAHRFPGLPLSAPYISHFFRPSPRLTGHIRLSFRRSGT